ncbi:hypothetical protein Pint_30935 [Pistacia integerrima]|uniref:Uncharacterized protein n=2 Tax=Pistacia TaxID=55512 RepID=A0ACC0XQY4_9ROSI|nr:hypothetical protein Pint_30935 [Pistacia integerrima]
MLMVEMECENSVLSPQPDVSPSPRCCMAVRKVSVSCLCNFVIAPVEINLVHVAQYCGTQFTPGTRCGSYTLPPA